MKYLVPLLVICAIICMVHAFPTKHRAGQNTEKLNELLAMASVYDNDMADEESLEECFSDLADPSCLMCVARCLPRPKKGCVSCLVRNCGPGVVKCIMVCSENGFID